MAMFFNGQELINKNDLLLSNGYGWQGGENLLAGSAFKSIEDMKAKGWRFSDESKVSVAKNDLIINAENNHVDAQYEVDLLDNRPFTLSFQMVSLTNKALIFLVEHKDDGSNSVPYKDHLTPINYSYNRGSNTFTFRNVGQECKKAALIFRAEANTTFQFRLPKYENGIYATPWTPSPADL